MDKFNTLSVRTTFDNNATPDSYEIKAYQYKLLATEYNEHASIIEIWDKNKNNVLTSLIYTPIHNVSYNMLKCLFVSILP